MYVRTTSGDNSARESNRPLSKPKKPPKSPTVGGLSDLLIWVVNGHVVNDVNVVNNVNANLNDLNDANVNHVNDTSNINPVRDERFLINHFLNIKYPANVKLYRNIFFVSLKKWGILKTTCQWEEFVYACFCLYWCCLCLFFVFYVRKKLLLMFGKI